MLTDIEQNPVVLHCFIHENYGRITLGEFPSKNARPDPLPWPGMADRLTFRLWFIIRNLPSLADSIDESDLVRLLQFVVKKAIYSTSVTQPATLADECLFVLNNSEFYESRAIRGAFPMAALPLMAGRHFTTKLVISPKMYLRSLLIGSMPAEFLLTPVALSSFIGLFLAFEQQLVVEAPAWQGFSAVDAMSNILPRLPRSSLAHNFSKLFESLPDEAIAKIMPIVFSMLGKIPPATFSRVSQVVAVADYCWRAKCPLPFEALLFADDITAFCAQLKTGFPLAIDFLLTATMAPSDIVPIVSALTQIPSNCFDRFTPEFMSHLIDMVVANDSALPSIPTFAAQLPMPILLLFLQKAPLSLYPAILQLRTFSKEEFNAHISPFVERLLTSYPPATVARAICEFRFTRWYSSAIVQRIALLVIYHSQKVDSIGDVTLLASCTVQLMTNCSSELMRWTVVAHELVRKLSHSFAKRASSEPPTHKQLRTIAKMYAAVSKVSHGELLHYLIASFVSHVAIMQLDEGRMKVFQGAAMPVFGKCSKSQLGEVSMALHDAHRQIFQQLYAKWQAEMRFTGKV
jgi:hypothetical protein